MDNHLITRQIGNLRGFSTSSIFLRPSNVATRAVNIQKAPDNTLQLRRGYQCQIGQIGGMGLSTLSDPALNDVQTVCVGMDGNLYNKLTKQIFFYYDGQITGEIENISNANPAIVHSVGHGLITGTQIIIRAVDGMSQVNDKTFTITVIDPDNFSLNGTNSIAYTPYLSGGYWSIAFADNRYLTFTIFVDPRYIYNNSGQSITCDIITNRAAQVNGNQVLVNTVTVQFGHTVASGDVIQFTSNLGVFNQRNVLSVTSTTITFDGTAVSFLNGAYINQFIEILFGKGFDVGTPYTIAQFISTITDPITGIFGLQVSVNGLTNLPAAFLQIVEPIIIDNNLPYTMDYWYWNKVNSTFNPPLPGSGNIEYQNSQYFENASMAAYDDVLYICNGWDYPQKYDGQTIYRTGMPEGIRPLISDNTSFLSQPFVTTNTYQYAITYEQIDSRGHIVEGIVSEVMSYTVIAATAASNVVLQNLISTFANNWNTNGALAVGGEATSYGPDLNGFYYDLVALDSGFTLKIGDSAYYGDITCAVLSSPPVDGFTFNVFAGHGILAGDTIYFFDTSGVEHQRIVASVTSTTITIQGSPVIVSTTYPNILDYIVSTVFGNVAIVNGVQNDVNTITVLVNHTIQMGDIVSFFDNKNNIQRRNVTGISGVTITIDGIPVSVLDGILIASENQRTDAVNLQRLNANPATLSDGVATPFVISNAISNNLRINIYRTPQGGIFDVNNKIFLVASIPNDSSGAATQTYIDGLPDTELGRDFANPQVLPYPPPISKYVISFGNQVIYAGGERGVAENSDRFFFSEGNFPEWVDLARNFYNVPNLNDDITGIGIAGSTLVITKNNSLWAVTGILLTGNIEMVQIAQGSNIGCAANATIASVGTLMYFLHTNGVYAITENQLYPTDAFGNPVPITLAIDNLFRTQNYLPQYRYVYQRAVAVNYTKDNQYLLFLPCEDVQTTIRDANANSLLLAYDYQEKNWFEWNNMNAAGGMVVVNDDLYFQERRFSGVNGNTANFYKQHRFYRLVDHADHAGPQKCEWLSSWEDLGQPEVRKKFCRCILLMDRLSSLLQFNNPQMVFSSYLNRLPNLQSTISNITTVDNIRNSAWSYSPWSWGYWSGYQDSFITVNLKQGTVAKSMQVGFTIQGINMDIKFAGFQLEAIPENRKTVVR